MEKWPSVNESERPFGLRVGDAMIWNGLHIDRQEASGPNWHYLVNDGGKMYRVNVFSPGGTKYRITVQRRPRVQPRIFAREDLAAESPEEALVQALMRVFDLSKDDGSVDLNR
jgi:hypothetical protein